MTTIKPVRPSKRKVLEVVSRTTSITGYTELVSLALDCGHRAVMRVRVPDEGEPRIPRRRACPRGCRYL